MAIGTVFVFSAGANVGIDYNLRYFYNFATLRQICFFPLAVAIMYLFSLIDYKRLDFSHKHPLRSPVIYLLILSIALLILVLIPRFGTEVNYARRWLRLPIGPISLSFQPSELAKWSVIFFLAASLARFRRNSDKISLRQFLLICIIVGLVAGLIVTEDFGTAAFIVLLTFLMLVIAGTNWLYFACTLPFVVTVFSIALFTVPGRIQRLLAFFNPEKLASSAAYQANQSLVAISTGGLFGKGLGKGICKYGHLPEDTTDFIFAIIAEEMGFVGAAAVICLFISLAVLGIMIIKQSKDYFGRLLAAGIVLTLTLQAAINIGVVTVVLPTKGISLPFVSAGGTSMLLSSVAVGLLMNVAKQKQSQFEK